MMLTCHCLLNLLQERWLDNRDCAYAVGSGGELSEGERRIKRFAPFSDGIKNCLGQVSWVFGGCEGFYSTPVNGVQ